MKKKPNAIKPFVLRFGPCLEASDINSELIEKYSVTSIPLWYKTNLIVIFHNGNKSSIYPRLLKQNFTNNNRVSLIIRILILMVPRMKRQFEVIYKKSNFSKTLRLSGGGPIYTAETI